MNHYKFFKIAIGFGLFLLNNTLKSQVAENLSVSFIISPTISWLNSDENTIKTYDNRFGFKTHIQGEYHLNNKFSLTAGIGLSLLEGGKLTYSNGGHFWPDSKLNIPHPDSLPNGVQLGFRINYFDIPFGFKFQTEEFGRYRFYIQTPEFILQIRRKARGSILGDQVSSNDINIAHEVHFFNFAWAIGAGTEYRITENLYLIAGLRYMQTLNDVNTDTGRYFDGSKENSRISLSNLDFRIGVKF